VRHDNRKPTGRAKIGHGSHVAAAPSTLSASEIYNGRKVFIIGATGFVGKVALGMLLQRFPQVARVYVMVRRGTGTDSESRFWNSVIRSPVFDPLRAKYPTREAFEAFVRDKVRVVDGDICEEHLGMTADEAEKVAKDIDVVINSSGRVTFNPPIESAIRTNVGGTKNVISFVKRMRRPALLHTSTCFVAGNRSGEVWEDEELDGYFPRHADMPGTQFSVEQEIKDVERIALEVRAQSTDATVSARLRIKARERLLEQGRDPDDESTLRLGIARERKDWVRNESTERGMARAAEWGWPNIYTYTKSMGDQLVARETDIARAIVRPAIVESSLSYPFPGWNEGFTTSAPLVFLSLKGQHMLPAAKRLILDIVPVDHVAAGMLMVAAQLCVEQPKLVFQLSSGDLNPSRMDRVTTITGLYKRQRLQVKEAGNKFINDLVARMELRSVEDNEYKRWSLPMFQRITGKISSTLSSVRPSWGGGRFGTLIDRMKNSIDNVKRVADEAQLNVDLFRPFIHDNEYVFRADNIRGVRDRLPESDRKLLDWSPENLDWYDYFMNVHFPGLQKWVLPELDQTYAARPKSVYAYRDLLELFDTTTKLHATRVAMRMDRDGREESYTYDNVKELAYRAGAFLVGHNVAQSDCVMLFAKNAPEWGMAYFGILKAGATVVPISHESTIDEVVNIARASEAVGLFVGEDLAAKHSGLAAALSEAKLATKIWTLSDVFAIETVEIENERIARFPRLSDSDAIASLIFTSGTTGSPKGVMLTHRNLTFMVSELLRIFDFGVTDGVLSVLPLHHTFEFSGGFLCPLSRGAQISYVAELNGDSINRVLKRGHVTAIVGVPALWELLRRRVLNKFSNRSATLGKAVEALADLSFELRSRTGINLGALMFMPVHNGFGGRIRYLISGGSALPPDVLKTFQGMGFDFFEGYGLTESSPVLTVSSPHEKPKPGSAGKPLIGVEVKIADPDAKGVGEVIARGRNVMAGYWRDEAATRATIRDGWLHTGDLGRFDEDGNLFLVGRLKDIIVDANGKNVYPDELEELYGGCEFVKELSVVGVPDGRGERIACAVVVDREREPALSDEERRARIERHFQSVSQSLPFWKRVKGVEFWDGDLPRTVTKKVKRRDVVRLLQEKLAATQPASAAPRDGDVAWFINIVATVTGKLSGDISLSTRVDLLGFDSLMYSELSAALDADGAGVSPDVDFTGAPDVASLFEIVRASRGVHGGARKSSGQGGKQDHDAGEKKEIQVPDPIVRLGRTGLRLGQNAFYKAVLQTEIKGFAHVPRNESFIVASNHTSHLDMGALKVALGEAGRGLASLAAADYFFSTRWRRAWFENFTNLVAMERAGSVRKSLEIAEDVLRSGRSMVVFPEGTRSRSGVMKEFLPSIGYLALRSGVGVVPAYIEGAHASLPVGKSVPRSRDIQVVFGPFLSIDMLRAATYGMPQQEAWAHAALLVERVVTGLRDRKPFPVDPDSLRNVTREAQP